jgi:hypothetical protein
LDKYELKVSKAPLIFQFFKTMKSSLNSFNQEISITYVDINTLKQSAYNPRKWTPEAMENLKESIRRFGTVDPVIVNSGAGRKNILVGGHMRVQALKELGEKTVPVVFVNIPDQEKEKELNLRLNKNTGEWNLDLLAEFDPTLLDNIGFSSIELDDIFGIDDTPEEFDLQKELQKLQINKIEIQKQDVWQLGENRLMCGDSTIESDILHLMNEQKADMCFTDEPYLLDYLHGKKKHGKATEGFGYKRDRRYLDTDVLPPDFVDKWMSNISKVQKSSFSIIAFENWKNIRELWNQMEKHWKVKNMIVWHLPNRHQGFSAKYKFFSKHDIALVGASKNTDVKFNHEPEHDGLQEEYQTALYAISGKPQ